MGSAKRNFGYNNVNRERQQRGQIRDVNTTTSYSSTPRHTQTTKYSVSDSLRTQGGLMSGPVGYVADALAISSGDLDLEANAAGNTVKIRKIVFVSPESGTSDTLDTITAGGKEIPGQELRLVGITNNTITITHNSGSASGNKRAIICPNDSDLTLTDDAVVDLFYDVTNNRWLVTNSASTTGTYIAASLSADQTSNLTATNHVEFDTTDADGSITLETGAGQADGIFQLKANKTYLLISAVRAEFSSNSGQLVIAWYDRDNATEVGKRGIYEAETGANDDANQTTVTTILNPSTDIDVEVRIISQTDLSALANEYCYATIHELGGASSGGGGSVSFPITPTINDHGNVGTTTEDIDLSASDGHVHKITLTGDPTLTFSNPPASGTQIEFEIEFVQDGTGGHTVTFPSEVVETVTINTSADTTTIVTFRTNDGGTNYHAIPALRGSISLSGGNFANTALNNLVSPSLNTDLNVNTNNLTNVGYMEQDGTASTSGAVRLANNSSLTWRNVGDSGNFGITGSTADNIVFFSDSTNPRLSGVNGLSMSGTIADSGTIRMANNTSIRFRNAADSANKLFRFNSSDEFEVDADFDMNNNVMKNVIIEGTTATPATTGDIRLGNNAGIDWRNNAGSGNLRLKVNTSDQLEFDGTVLGTGISNVVEDLTPELGGDLDALGNNILNAAVMQSNATNPASAGAVRLGNNESVLWRNAANSADIGIKLDTSNQLDMGGVRSVNVNGITMASANPADSGTIRMSNNTSIRFRNAANSANKLFRFNSSDEFEFDANLDMNNGIVKNVIIEGTTGTPSTTGDIRLGNNASIRARDAGNSANVDILKVNTSDEVEMGSKTVFTADVDFDANVQFGTANSDTVTFTSKINSDMGVVGGNVVKSNDTTEIGFQVTNESITLGTEGTLQIPHISGSSSTAAAADADFGDKEGCMGIYTNTTSNTHTLVIRQADGNWAGVILADNTLT